MGIMGLIVVVAAVPSLLVIPAGYVAFRKLLGISGSWPRVLATAAVITGCFLLTVTAVATAILGSKYSLLGIMSMGGWAYLLSALGAAAVLYRKALFRPDNAEEIEASETEEPTA